EVDPRGVRSLEQPAARSDDELVASRRRQPAVGEQAAPGDLTKSRALVVEERDTGWGGGRPELGVQRRFMRRDDGERQAFGPRVDPAGGDGARGDGERQAPGAMEQLELGRREQAWVEVRERLALDGRAEIQHRGVALPGEGQ